MVILYRCEKMITIVLAGIRIGFQAEFEIKTDEKIEKFIEAKDNHTECDYLFSIESKELPPFPNEKLLYEEQKMCLYQAEETTYIYYRQPNKKWEFCLEKTQTENTIYVRPDCKKYAENIWNLVNKIELSSLLLKKEALILHASYIIYRGQAILFTAPSGTGKSTQAQLWKDSRGAEIVNGDRAIIKMNGEQLYAYGLPFSGSSDICENREAQIRGIVVLEQAKGNCVKELSFLEKFKMLYSQVAVFRWKQEDVRDTIEVLNKMIQNISIVKLCCLPDVEAVDVLEQYFETMESEESNL